VTFEGKDARRDSVCDIKIELPEDFTNLNGQKYYTAIHLEVEAQIRGSNNPNK
jgi:hypothetical protein